MSIWDDIKKAAKGSKAYQKRKKGPISKAVKQVKKDVKSAVKGSKEYQAGKAKKKAGKSWTKAVKKQKKAGGSSMNELIKARNAAKASGDTAKYAAAQNQINKAYGSKKVHDPGKPKSLPKKKPVAKAPKVAAKKPKAPEFTEADVARHKENLKKHSEAMAKSKFTDSAAKAKDKKPTYEELSKNVTTRKKMEGGGKVESNPYGWPSSDSRKR